MKKLIILLTLMFTLLAFGCASNAGVVQKDETSYLKLTGNTHNLTIQIDEGPVTSIVIHNDNTLFEIKPGTHTITIRRDSVVISQRKIFFDDQVTREVNVK